MEASGNEEGVVESEETTDLPTDLTLSVSSGGVAGGESASGSNDKSESEGLAGAAPAPALSANQKQRLKAALSRQYEERERARHECELLRLEMSERRLETEAEKSRLVERVEELEGALAEAVRGGQVVRQRAEARVEALEAEARRRNSRARGDLDEIVRRQREVESVNERLQEAARELRGSVRRLDLISEGEYERLRGQDESVLPLNSYLNMRVYEVVRRFTLENQEYHRDNMSLKRDLLKSQRHLEIITQKYQTEREQKKDSQEKQQSLASQLVHVKKQVQVGDYKINNFDALKSECDKLRVEVNELRKSNTYLDSDVKTLRSEKENAIKELSGVRQKVHLLTQDKDHLHQKCSESRAHSLQLSDRLTNVTQQLDEARAAREELYEKYMTARGEYESRLHGELDEIRSRTSAEIDQVKVHLKQLYDTENRSLKEARDEAVSDKERHQMAENEANRKYEELLHQHRESHTSHESRVSDLMTELKVKSFDVERLSICREEMNAALNRAEAERNTLREKLEECRRESERSHIQLEAATGKLEIYERLESELDDIVMQAAQVSDLEEANKILFAHGYGSNVPTTTRRRLQQSVYLARKVLELERSNMNKQKELDEQTNKYQMITDKLKSANEMLTHSDQPYHYLVECIDVRDRKIEQHQDTIQNMETEIRKMRVERDELISCKNEMQSDLERLVKQQQDVVVMKKLLSGVIKDT